MTIGSLTSRGREKGAGSLIERLFGLKDRVAPVTGSSAGIGAAIFLSCDAFPVVKEHILYVDGGLTASV